MHKSQRSLHTRATYMHVRPSPQHPKQLVDAQIDLVSAPQLMSAEGLPWLRIGLSARVIREPVDHSAHHPGGKQSESCLLRPPREMSHTTFTVPHMNEPPR